MRGRDEPARWARAVVRARALCLIVAAVVTVAAAGVATRLDFNFSPENLFVSGDPTLRFYLDEQVPAFGAGDTVCAVAFLGDLRKPRVQQALLSLHQALERTKGVLEVQSPASAVVPTEGAFGFRPLLQGGRARVEDLARAAKDPLIGGLLLSEGLDVAQVAARVETHFGREEARRRVVEAVRRVLDEVKVRYPEVDLLLTGIPVSQITIIDTLKRDQLVFVPLIVLVMGALLFLSFRDLRGVVLPFLATSAATLWALAYLVLQGHAINVVNNAIVLLLLVIGVADAVHIVARFEDELEKARARGGSVDKEEILARVVEGMALPCLLTTTTTAVGLGSAVVADIALIREFGLDAAVGVLFAFVTTMLIVPAALGVLSLPPPKARRERGAGLGDLLQLIARASVRNRVAVSLFGLIGLLVCAVLALHVDSNQRTVVELPGTDPTIEAMRVLEERLAGILPFDVVFAADDPERLTSPEVLREMDRLARLAREGLPGASARSLADVLATVERALTRAEKGSAVSSWSDEKIRQLWLLLELAPERERQKVTSAFLSADGRLARIRGLAPDVGTRLFGPFRDRLEAEIEKVEIEGVRVRLSGGHVIATRALENIVEDMTSSLAVALFAILVFMSILFRSLKIGLLALAPNAVPIVAALALMAIFGIPLRVATALIFSMSLGIAVDACVHLLARLREELRAGGEVSLEAALARTFRGAGRPVAYATVLLLLGFAVMGLSEFAALRHFAVLAAATLGAALVVDLVLLPALVAWVRPRLGVKDGERESDVIGKSPTAI